MSTETVKDTNPNETEHGPIETIEASLYSRAEMIIAAFRFVYAADYRRRLVTPAQIPDGEILQMIDEIVATGTDGPYSHIMPELIDLSWMLRHPTPHRRYQLARAQFDYLSAVLRGENATLPVIPAAS